MKHGRLLTGVLSFVGLIGLVRSRKKQQMPRWRKVELDYHPDDFMKLSEQVEAEGGSCLAEPCVGKTFSYKEPDGRGGHRWIRLSTTRCNTSARMQLPYDATQPVRIYEDKERIVDHKGEGKGAHNTLIVCAVDDAVGLWPRFAHCMSGKSTEKTTGPQL